MPIRGVRNPFPKKGRPTNSGIFSDSGAGQKMDPHKVLPENRPAVAEAMRNANSKSGSGDTGASASAVRDHVFANRRDNGGGSGAKSPQAIRRIAMGNSRKRG